MLASQFLAEPHEEADVLMPENRDRDEDGPLISLRITQAVTNQKVEEVGRLVTELRNEVRELKSTFATKADLQSLEEEVTSLKANQGWIVKIIVGAVVSAVLGIVLVKGGVPHP